MLANPEPCAPTVRSPRVMKKLWRWGEDSSLHWASWVNYPVAMLTFYLRETPRKSQTFPQIPNSSEYEDMKGPKDSMPEGEPAENQPARSRRWEQGLRHSIVSVVAPWGACFQET